MFRRQSELGDDEIHHPSEQVILVANMVIEGHGLDAEALAQLPHGQ
jgi:hemerythrin-like domain-containing protein